MQVFFYALFFQLFLHQPVEKPGLCPAAEAAHAFAYQRLDGGGLSGADLGNEGGVFAKDGTDTLQKSLFIADLSQPLAADSLGRIEIAFPKTGGKLFCGF